MGGSVAIKNLQNLLDGYTSTLQASVAAGTPALGGTPLLQAYAGTGEHFTPTGAGRIYVCVALSAAAELTVSRNAGSSAPIYDGLATSQSLVASSEYEFDLLVDPTDAIDFKLGADVTVNVLKVYSKRGL